MKGPSTSITVETATTLEEMKRHRQWVAWRYAQSSGEDKKRKVPVNPRTGQPANTTNPETWGTFDDALRRKKKDRLPGVGFVFSQNDPFTGTDLDGCVDPQTGEIEPWAWEIVQELDSHTELSPSRTGLHILARAKLKIGFRHAHKIGVYSGSGYMTITGHALFPDKGVEVRQRQTSPLIP